MRRLMATLALPAVLLTGCYHATVTTGLPASSETVSQPWAMGWLFGLIPPPTVETASKCKNGVAKIETQLSFLNMLASFITFNIFTPMQIDVTCASSNKMGAVPTGAQVVGVKAEMNREELTAALTKAAELSRTTAQPVYFVHE